MSIVERVPDRVWSRRRDTDQVLVSAGLDVERWSLAWENTRNNRWGAVRRRTHSGLVVAADHPAPGIADPLILSHERKAKITSVIGDD